MDADRGILEMVTQISTAAGLEVDAKAEAAEQVAQVWRGWNARNLPCLVILDNLPETWRFGPTWRPQDECIPLSLPGGEIWDMPPFVCLFCPSRKAFNC